jgi:hypothetical protein
MAAPVATSPFERNRPSVGRWLGAGLVGMALLVFASPLGASPEFPAAVQDALQLACAPPCTLCHTSPAGGSVNAEQPFVNNLLGMVTSPPLAVGNMAQALTALETVPCSATADPGCQADPTSMACTGVCNADGDDTPDVQELRNGTNPNPGGADLKCPQYGCGARIAPIPSGRPIDGTAALAALGMLVLLASRWRRR